MTVTTNPSVNGPGQGFGSTTNITLQNFATAATAVVGTGVTAADFASLQAAHDGLPAAGGSIKIVGVVNIGTNTLTVTKPIAFWGDGASDGYSAEGDAGLGNYANSGDVAVSVIQGTSTTATLIQVNAKSCSFKYIHFRGPTNATAGAGIVMGAAGANGVNCANGIDISHCSFFGFWMGIQNIWAANGNISFNKFYRQVQFGMSWDCINATGDEGEMQIVGNTINSGLNAASPLAAFNWTSGGGIKWLCNKINSEPPTAAVRAVGWTHGMRINPSNGISSGVFVITGNSIENTLTTGIYIRSMTAENGGNINGIIITNNEFLSGGTTLDIVSDNGGINRLDFSHNTAFTIGSLVRMNYAVGVKIGPNTVNGQVLTAPVLDIQNGVDISYKWEDQHVVYRAANCSIVRDNYANSNNTNNIRGGVVRRYVREMPALNLTSTAVALFKIDIASSVGYNAAEIEIQFNGFLSGPGAHINKIRRVIYGNGAGVGAAVTPTGWTDYVLSPTATTTTQAYLTWTITNSSGVLTISVTAATAVGTPIINNATFAGIASGEVVLTVNGPVRELIVA